MQKLDLWLLGFKFFNYLPLYIEHIVEFMTVNQKDFMIFFG